jgi:hypothetical protein
MHHKLSKAQVFTCSWSGMVLTLQIVQFMFHETGSEESLSLMLGTMHVILGTDHKSTKHEGSVKKEPEFQI